MKNITKSRIEELKAVLPLEKYEAFVSHAKRRCCQDSKSRKKKKNEKNEET